MIDQHTVAHLQDDEGPGMKRIYKFTAAKHGLSSLKNKRLKLSIASDLNDPFDLFGVIDTSDPKVLPAVLALAEYERTLGILCFSRNWDNLLLWSHYAASHTGLCLGFDIPNHHGHTYMDVHYQPNLLQIRGLEDVNLDLATRSLSTKHESWSYEQEVRMFANLTEPPDEQGLHWINFGPGLQLKEVIIGVQCRTESANEACDLLKSYPDQIKCTWAHMRSDAFLLVRGKTAHSFRPSKRNNEPRKEK